MSQNMYVAFTLIGMFIVVFVSHLGIMDYSKVLAGLLMGIGLSISTVSFFKVLVKYKGKTAEK